MSGWFTNTECPIEKESVKKMLSVLKTSVSASWLAEHAGLELRGNDLNVSEVCPLNGLKANCLCFSTQAYAISVEVPVLVIGPEAIATDNVSVLVSDNARLDYVIILELLEKSVGFERHLTPPKVHESVKLGRNVVLENGVEIGKGTVIYHNVVIAEGVRIGEDCLIKSGAIIGEEGFGMENDEKNVPRRMLHLGSVVIGNGVEIGNGTVIACGSIGDTVINDNVKISDLVSVGHNCVVGDNVIITPCAQISGSVELGQNAWVSPSSSIIEKVKIGDGATVGIGSVVTRNVKEGATVFGIPARKL